MILNPSNTPFSIWLAEGQSSQREMLLAMQAMKCQYNLPMTIVASHRQPRPEILNCADIAYQEPSEPSERVEFVLEQAKHHHVKVVLTGRNSQDYEVRRQDFKAAGIRLLTGATDTATLELMDDKAAFTAFCQQHDIPVASGWQFDNTDELMALLALHGEQPLCVKPVKGIFAQGFWRLDTAAVDAWDSFEHLYFTEDKKIHLAQFLHAYNHSQMVTDKPIAMLLMPYLAGKEYSIDVVCETGEVLAAVTRYKDGSEQHVGYDEAVMELVKHLVAALKADGIVSIQTKADENGMHKVLEINSRASGGIGYTDHAFDKGTMNLTQLAFAYWSGCITKPQLAAVRDTITPCIVRPLMTSVKIG